MFWENVVVTDCLFLQEPTPLQTHVATGITESHQLSGSQGQQTFHFLFNTTKTYIVSCNVKYLM